MDERTTTSRPLGARPKDSLPRVPDATLGSLLGATGELADATVDELLVTATGRHAAPGLTSAESLPHSMGSPATAGVYRVRGQDTDGAPWSMVCKVLQHVRHWPGLHFMPPDIASDFVASFPWRSELELWDPRVQASLPSGLRSPVLHRLVDLGDDRVAVWQEDVREAPGAWEEDRTYARAAFLLGRWNARSTTPEVLAVSELAPGFALRMYAEKAVAGRGLPALRDDELWRHPWLVDHRDLAATLADLGGRIPALLDRLDAFPQALPHGDASPQNLLVQARDEADLVAIDVSFRSPHAIGFDLGQLLVGLVHADIVHASRLPDITAVIVPAYVDGLVAEGLRPDTATVREGFATSALLRSGFDGFLYEELDGADPATPPSASFTQRVQLARFLVDLFVDATVR